MFRGRLIDPTCPHVEKDQDTSGQQGTEQGSLGFHRFPVYLKQVSFVFGYLLYIAAAFDCPMDTGWKCLGGGIRYLATDHTLPPIVDQHFEVLFAAPHGMLVTTTYSPPFIWAVRSGELCRILLEVPAGSPSQNRRCQSYRQSSQRMPFPSGTTHHFAIRIYKDTSAHRQLGLQWCKVL